MGCSIRAYSLPRYKLLAKFTMPGTNHLLWSHLGIWSENNWLPQQQSLHLWACLAWEVACRFHHCLRILVAFTPAVVYHLGHFESYPGGGKFSSQCSLISPCPETKTCCVCSNKILLSCYGAKPRGMVIDLCCLEGTYTSDSRFLYKLSINY